MTIKLYILSALVFMGGENYSVETVMLPPNEDATVVFLEYEECKEAALSVLDDFKAYIDSEGKGSIVGIHPVCSPIFIEMKGESL